MANDETFLATILADLCADMGAELSLEAAHGRAGFVTFKNGRRCFFKNACFDINGMGAAQITKDKDYCAKFLDEAGINTPASLGQMQRRRKSGVSGTHRTHIGGDTLLQWRKADAWQTGRRVPALGVGAFFVIGV